MNSERPSCPVCHSPHCPHATEYAAPADRCGSESVAGHICQLRLHHGGLHRSPGPRRLTRIGDGHHLVCNGEHTWGQAHEWSPGAAS